VKIAVLTGGGDCPGLNAAVRAVVYRAEQRGHTVWGLRDGWKGLLSSDPPTRLDRASVQEIVGWGGTVLGSSRTNPFKSEDTAKDALRRFQDGGFEGLVAIGGDDTLSAALAMHQRGGPVVGVPKTMDNDVEGTDWTFGFDSATSVAMDALSRLRDTARSHHRVLILEVMGRHAGWVALLAGLASGADYTVLPEEPFDIARFRECVQRAIQARGYALVVASEGAEVSSDLRGGTATRDDFGHEILREKGVAAYLARRLEEEGGWECRTAVIGHIQRGGPPTLFDRVLATRLGAYAIDLVERREFGKVAVLRGEEIRAIPLAEAVARTRKVSPYWLDLLHTFDA
jgi:phosphofructokinase-like protein